jgi:hydrogenase-4 component F
VVIHLIAHAIAKTLGFCASTPLLAYDPAAAITPITGIARRQPGLGASMAVSVAALAGVPPSPIFASELLIVAGGLQSRWSWATTIAIVLLALAFLALAGNLLNITLGDLPSDSAQRRRPVGMGGLRVLTAAAVLLLLALSATAIWLPGSDLARAVGRGLQ